MRAPQCVPASALLHAVPNNNRPKKGAQLAGRIVGGTDEHTRTVVGRHCDGHASWHGGMLCLRTRSGRDLPLLAICG